MPQTPFPRLPLVQAIESRDVVGTKDARLVNAFANRNERGELSVYKRDGVVLSTTVTSVLTNPVTLGLVYTQRSSVPAPYLVFSGLSGGNTAVEAVLTSGASSGAVSINPNTASGRATAVQTGLSQAVVSFLGGGGKILVINTAANTAAAVTAGAFVSTDGVITLDGFTYLMDVSGNIYGSALSDPTTWPAASIVPANRYPGNGISLQLIGEVVVAMKQFSTEFLYDAGNAVGSPLSPILGAAFEIGCMDGGTPQNIDGSLYWLATTKAALNNPFVVRMSTSRQPERISTPEVERLVQGTAIGGGNLFSFQFRSLGHTFYGFGSRSVNLPAQGFTLVFDINTGVWSRFTSPEGGAFNYHDLISDGVSKVLGVNNTGQDGNVYQIDQSIHNDRGVVFPVDIYTPNYDGGVKRTKHLQNMDFIADQQGGMLQSRFTEDDYQTWSQFRAVDLNQRRPRLTRCGSFYRRAYHFHHAASLPLRLMEVELDVQLGIR